MTERILVGCSGWNYPDRSEKGGWVGSFYPDAKTRFLSFYSRYFRTVEMDSTFYDRFYSKMTQGTFIGIGRAAGEGLEVSVKVPETITHVKHMSTDSFRDFELFLEKIGPLKRMNKLGVILFQLPPHLHVDEFAKVESFLEKLPRGYQYAVEFRHPSWYTEGPWELLRQYNIAAVMTDSPEGQLQFLSKVTITADHAFIRMHGRNPGLWYNYRYTDKELEEWVVKVNEMVREVKVLRIYFNNHYEGNAPYNALMFKAILGQTLSSDETAMLQRLREFFGNPNLLTPS